MALASARAVLFDIDGTLCDSSKLCFDATNSVLQNNGFAAITLTEYKEGSKYTTPRRFAWHVSKDPDNSIGNQLGDEFDRKYVAEVNPVSVPMFPKVADMIVSLRKQHAAMKMGALTNACSAYARAIQASNPVLLEHFSICVGVDDVPAAKPSGAGLLTCCSVIGALAAESIYIGDAPTDGQAAAAAGMTSIGVTWGSYPKASMVPCFTHLVDTVDELETLVRKLLASSL